MQRERQSRIDWYGGILDFSGYGYLSRHTLLALDRLGARVRANPFSEDPRFMEQLRGRPAEFRTWARLVAQDAADGIFVMLHPPVSYGGGEDFLHAHYAKETAYQAIVGASMFETDRLPTGWAQAHNATDEVWVPSEFNRESYARAGVNPERIQVIPFGIDVQAYRPRKVRPLQIPGHAGFTFLSVFQWNLRKGWDVLIEAWLEAFRADDDVRLLLRTYPDRGQKDPPIAERIQAHITRLGRSSDSMAPIQVIDDFIPEEKMPALYAAADAFVLPTRGEGLGIPFLEALAMECPVIATRWSAHLDFLDESNSYLIDIDGLVPVAEEMTRTNPYYTTDHLWAQPSVRHTAELLRHVYEHREEARSRARRGAREVRRNWSAEGTARWILKRCRALEQLSLESLAR